MIATIQMDKPELSNSQYMHSLSAINEECFILSAETNNGSLFGDTAIGHDRSIATFNDMVADGDYRTVTLYDSNMNVMQHWDR